MEYAVEGNILKDNKFVDLFDRNGFVLIKNIFNREEVEEMQAEMRRIVDDIDPESEPKATFTTYNDKKHISDSYFLNSVDKISHFFEEGSIDAETSRLLVPKHLAFNKVGHALHWLNPIFKKFTFDSRIKRIAQMLELSQPRIVQSMYIFKQPKLTQSHENSVHEHIDSTFLRVEPQGERNLVGVWIALDNATIENGCLWFVPGSHKNKELLAVNELYRFVRTQPFTSKSEQVEKEFKKDLLEFIGEKPKYEGQFIPVEVESGSLVLINGNVVHKSETNSSAMPRHAYTFHIVEFNGTQWNNQNWLQETESYKFPSLYEN